MHVDMIPLDRSFEKASETPTMSAQRSGELVDIAAELFGGTPRALCCVQRARASGSFPLTAAHPEGERHDAQQ
jgi:hypothetical protein